MSSKIGSFDPLTTATTIIQVPTSASASFYAPLDSDLNDDAQYTLSGTASGNAAIQTSVKKLGVGSLYLPSRSGDFVTYDDSSNPISFSSNYTIEAYVQLSDITSANNYIWSKRENSSTHANSAWAFKWMGPSGNAWEIYQAQGSSQHVTSHSDSISAGVWYHIAVVRSGTDLLLFRDGNLISGSNTTGAGGALNTPSTNIVLGDLAGGSSNGFAGYIDDFRISQTAIYTTSFSPPTAPVGVQIAIPTSDSRTHSHVWNYKDIYDPQIADNWPDPTAAFQIKCWGAGGGGVRQDGQNRLGAGGGGGFAQVGTDDLSAGTTLRIIVGSGGPDDAGDQQPITAGPFGGGGNGYHEEQAGAAGGGFSGVFVATATQVNAIVIAGGGGGGYFEVGGGGGGGGETGRDGVGGRPGLGGTQTSGGGIHPIVTGSSATVGSALQGGSGGNSGGNRAGAGGGGGYFGGGGGQAAAAGTNLNGGSGGGGSGFVGGSTANGITVTDPVNTQGSDGVGSGTINASGGSVANSGDVDYPGSPTGNGGAGASDATGGDGCVVIIEAGVATVFSSAGSYTFTVS